MNELPTPPAGTWWEIEGEPQGPWVWSSATMFQNDGNGFAVSAGHFAVASAPGATAVWRY